MKDRDERVRTITKVGRHPTFAADLANLADKDFTFRYNNGI